MVDKQMVEGLRERLGDYLLQKGLPPKRAFRCLSPVHEDKHPSMCYNVRSQRVHCFACGVTYDLFDLIGLEYGLAEFGDQLKKAQELFGMERKEFVVHVGAEVEHEDCGSFLEALRGKSDRDVGYFLSRGLDAGTVERHGLFQCDGRAYFPIVEGSRCVGWCARAVEDGVQPRYLNAAGPMGIWNGDLLLDAQSGEKIFVVEGILDALSLEGMGCRALALCGSQNGGKLIRRCREGGDALRGCTLVLCGDDDPAGRRMNGVLEEGLKELGIPTQTLVPEGGDWNWMLLHRRDRLKALLEGPSGEEASAGEYVATSAAGALDSFFQRRERMAGREAVPTGFSGLDKLLDGGLYPGLYVLGSISSLGKTSLALQMADAIAGQGRDVLFVSLEQSRFELMAKSLSRISVELAQEDCPPFTARQLLSGEPVGSVQRGQLLEQCRQAYERAAGCLFLRESLADVGAVQIRRMVEEHREKRGCVPVVVVDYLQILAPADPRLSDKQAVDRSVVELKRISRDFNLPVLAVSSFNRENYKTAVTMEAFKESGAVEYSADVLLGLQLQGAGGRDFDVNQAKLKEPRQLELVILKNRNGIPYAKLRLGYDARYNRFLPSGGRAASRYA